MIQTAVCPPESVLGQGVPRVLPLLAVEAGRILGKGLELREAESDVMPAEKTQMRRMRAVVGGAVPGPRTG
jgi:hypothetical protein